MSWALSIALHTSQELSVPEQDAVLPEAGVVVLYTNLHAKCFPDPLEYVVLVSVFLIILISVCGRVCYTYATVRRCFYFAFWFLGFQPKAHLSGDISKFYSL